MGAASCISYRNFPHRPHGPAGSGMPEVREFAYDDYRKLAAARSFVSKEELLQLLFVLYRGKRRRDRLVIRRPTIERVAREIHTYFPLAACRRIVLARGRLAIDFEGPQVVPIAGARRQASISFTRRLVFALSVSVEDPHSLQFEVIQGGLRVNVSWLLRLVEPFASDIQGTHMTYTVVPRQRLSAVEIREVRAIPPGRLKVWRQGDGVYVDVLHPELPDREDLYFRPAKVHVFGRTMDLDDFGAGKPRMAKLVRRVLADPHRYFSPGIVQTLSATYELEGNRLRFAKSFRRAGRWSRPP